MVTENECGMLNGQCGVAVRSDPRTAELGLPMRASQKSSYFRCNPMRLDAKASRR